MGRILYFVPHRAGSAGGVRNIFRHAAILRRHGADARVIYVADENAEVSLWFDTDVPYERVRRLVPQPGDVFVLPEGIGPVMSGLAPLGRDMHIFCQNHFSLFNVFWQNSLAPSAHDFEGVPLRGFMCLSGVIERAVRRAFPDYPASVVPPAFDLDLFRPGEKALQIAWMPRKRLMEGRYLVGLFYNRYPEHRDVPFVQIAGKSETEVAELLGRSAIFLSLSHLEGFGMPPVEAMAAGCLVAGFHGEGGREYAAPENGLWVEEGDHEGCVAALARLVDLVKRGDPAAEAYRRAGRQVAGHYDEARLEAALLDYWQAAGAMPELLGQEEGASSP